MTELRITMLELTPLFLYESFILVIGSAAVFAFAFFYFRLLKGYHILRQKYLEIEQNTKIEVDEVMKKSHQQAIATIEHSQILSQEMKKQLTQILRDAATKETSAYHQVMSEVSEDIKEESEELIEQFSQEMKEEVAEAESSFQTELKKKYQEVDREVNVYKEQRMAEVDQNIVEVVNQVLSQVTGKMITLDQQQELLIEAIQQAKHEQLL